MSDAHDRLDVLLATPLEGVPDDGFSSRAAKRAFWMQQRREWLAWLVPVLALCALVPFLPLDEFTHAVLRVTPVIANSAAISLALAALILTFMLEQRLRE